MTPAIEAEVTLLKTEDGGRSAPLRLEPGSPFYMPHLVIGDLQRKSGKLLGLDLMYHPQVDYRALVPGAAFTVREGPKIVGHGKVMKREDNGAI